MQSYRVVDNEFNRQWYPELIGKTYERPPAYVQVKPVGMWLIQYDGYDDRPLPRD